MAVIGGEQFMSLETKGGPMTVEEERDYYRQRFLSLKLVLKELQQQLLLYKTRCSGVDTVALMLKESKQEVMTLTKQRRALETAVANLQNRLSANGLSNSVSIEETELFVPGASKQTLDNLAKENARLRTLLKSHEAQASKKPSEDIHNMTALVEKLEAENNQLRVQLMEVEQLKLVVRSQYEDVIKRIKDAHQAEKQQLEQELTQNLQGQVVSSRHNESDCDIERQTKATQTVGLAPSKVDEVRQALRMLSDHCIALDQSLEHVQEEAKLEKIEKDNDMAPNDKNNMVSRAAYMELEQKLNQIIQMNQRWQAYNENQEQQIHGLNARIAELEQLNKEGEELQGALNAKEMENQTLKHQIMNLTREINKLRLQPPVDVSLIEILKQQIQVCTEDFNTERKDREHAVNKAKQLQDELNRVVSENEVLRKDIDNLQKIKHTPEVQFDKRESPFWMRSQPMPFNAFAGIPPDRLPFPSSSSSSGTSPSVGSSHSPVPSPVPMSFSSTSSAADRSSFYPSGPQDSNAGFRTLPRTGYRQQVSQASGQTSLPRARGPQEVQRSSASPVSMPALSNRSEGLAKPDLTCPKCSKEFAESQQAELIHHINSCTE
ncbi:unnamed protein product [Candidula unifasciata]|uniref:NF-kappa-B essential modulator NEMO CC2-LZ domain-containing protein n=1 Tax=Candidula unifasciata TaxID=100452 RepID=A0A8S3YTV8_9EUPU|nr:unnamed protein product [Candidula unifasciata]